MNQEILQRFNEYAKHPMLRSQVAAALLTLADVLSRPTPEPIIIEADGRETCSVEEAARRLNTSSKAIYRMCLAGKLRCVWLSARVRIPLDEIDRHL